MRTLETPAAPQAGGVPVIAVGGLGVGVRTADPASGYRPQLPGSAATRCGVGLPDHTNDDRDYETVNPEENALRALVASATDHVEISQQDLNATCPPLPRYDQRLYDVLAAKLAAASRCGSWSATRPTAARSAAAATRRSSRWPRSATC
ncbi:hypothetical protein ACFQ1I_38335 [Kitasatospora arboriphila]